MTRIGLISDPHGFLDEKVFEHFKDCHEVWHAVGWGRLALKKSLQLPEGIERNNQCIFFTLQ